MRRRHRTAPIRFGAAVAVLAGLAVRPAAARAEDPSTPEETTLVYVRASAPNADVWVTDVQFRGAAGDDWVYPDGPPCTAPCLLRLPAGRYDLAVGRVDLATYASGGLQVWDVEPKAGWMRGLAIGMEVVGGMLLGSLVICAVIELFSVFAFDPVEVMPRDAMIGVGVSGGALVLGSIPFWAAYASTGSSTLALEDPGFDLGGRVVLTPGAAVLPWEGDTPALALSLRGTWGHFRAPHERRSTASPPAP